MMEDRKTHRFAAAIAALGLAFGVAADVAGTTSQQSAEHFESRFALDYLLHVPPSYDAAGDSVPLLLFLHGAGERGTDLERVKLHGPPKLIAAGVPFPAIVVSPQLPEGTWWRIHVSELLALLDDIATRYNVDQDRVYVTGLSMGGFGTWSLAAYTPNRFAAIVPICGGGEPYWAKRFAHVPTWVFHGAKDRGVPLNRSQEMVDALKKHGGNPKLRVYPEAGHDAWTDTYDNPELYDWLLQQKRSDPQSPEK